MDKLKAALHTGPPTGKVTLRGVVVYSVNYGSLTAMDPAMFPADQASADTVATIPAIEHSYDDDTVLQHPIENDNHVAALHTYFNMRYGLKQGVPVTDMRLTIDTTALDGETNYMVEYCAHISVTILRYMHAADKVETVPAFFAVQASRIWAGAIKEDDRSIDVVNLCCLRKIYIIRADHPAYMEFLKAAHEFANINHENQLTIVCRNDAARFALGNPTDTICSAIRIWSAAWRETTFPPLCDPANEDIDAIKDLVARLKREIPHNALACIKSAKGGCQVHGRTCRNQKNKKYADIATDFHERQLIDA